MLNYRCGKERIKVNELGSLYIDYNKINDNERPIIYIGGQMEHRCHILEQTGYTADPGHNMFCGSWFYDYSIFNKDKSQLNTKNFADNLLVALNRASIGDVNLITESYGGLIGTYASKSSSIHKVIAIHPPILGTPLANKEMLEYAIKHLELEQRIIAKIINVILDDKYGFEIENSKGIYDSKFQYVADLSKLVVVGSNVNLETERNKLVRSLYTLILQLTDKESDGVVIFNRDDLSKFGIAYIEEEDNLSHFDAGSKENIDRAKRLVLER